MVRLSAWFVATSCQSAPEIITIRFGSRYIIKNAMLDGKIYINGLKYHLPNRPQIFQSHPSDACNACMHQQSVCLSQCPPAEYWDGRQQIHIYYDWLVGLICHITPDVTGALIEPDGSRSTAEKIDQGFVEKQIISISFVY